jgi:hypothetical protein
VFSHLPVGVIIDNRKRERERERERITTRKKRREEKKKKKMFSFAKHESLYHIVISNYSVDIH